MTGIKVLGAMLAFVLFVYILGFLATGGDLAIYRFWAPKQEAARREVFVQTQSYVQGKIGNIARMRVEYESAGADDQAHKQALRTMILTEASQISPDQLPPDQRAFVASLKGAF